MGKKVVIIGANHAGTACANQLLSSGQDIDLHIFDKNSNISFLGCGMALWIGEQITTSDGLFYNCPENFEKNGAKVKMETEITSIDFDTKTITYQDLKTGEKSSDKYDDLVLATGSRPIMPSIKGIELENVQVAKRFQDAQLAVDKMEDPSIKHVTVVGAGYIGVELAEAFKRKGRDVTLIDAQEHILASHFDADMCELMEKKLLDNGIELVLGQTVDEIKGNSKVEAIVCGGKEIKTDLVMMCIGFRPNSEIADGKLELGTASAIKVDKHQRTSKSSVYAIGDCSTIYDNSLQDYSYIALATNAVRSGIVAALNILGTEVESLGVQGSSALCIYGLKMVSTGLSVAAAQRHGIEVCTTEFNDLQKPAFMNEAGVNPEVKIRIVYRKEDHVVVGAQLVSEYDMSAVIHMFSLAIQEQVTIEKIALLDIFFMPHFNQPYNYITMAAISAK